VRGEDRENKMRNNLIILLIFAALTAMSGCGKSDPPPPPASDAARSSAPVKNVESLPSGTIREGARTMNTGAELGSTLEQQKRERDKEIESETK
jgi:predicted small lipoprotein YifL